MHVDVLAAEPSRIIKVGHVLTNLGLGGPQGWTLACARRADLSLFDVHVIAGPLGEDAPSHEDALALPSSQVHFVPALDRSIHIGRDVLALLQLIKILRRERFDVVHTHMSKAGVLGRLAARITKTPLIVHTAHGWSLWYSRHRLVRASVRVAERCAARWTDSLLVVSDHDRRVAVENIGLPPQLLADGRQGVSSAQELQPCSRQGARSRLNLPLEGEVVASVTRFVPHKRTEDFLRAAAIVQRQRAGTTFVIIGSGPEEATLRKLAAELNVEPLVWLHTRRDIVEVLPAFDVLVHPSGREGLPMTVLQALSVGIPVVAEDAGGTREVIQHEKTGLLVPIGDFTALAAGVLRMLSEPELRARLQSAGRRVIQERHEEEERVRAIERHYLERLRSAEPRAGRSARSARCPRFASRPRQQAPG